MVWGISGVDVTNNGWNLAVGCGVAAGCAVAATVVAKLGEKVFAAARDATTEQKASAVSKIKFAAVFAGLGAAYYATYHFVPNSRFELISDTLTARFGNVVLLGFGALGTAYATVYLTR